MKISIRSLSIAVLILVVSFSFSYAISFGGRSCFSCSEEKQEEEALQTAQDGLNRKAKDGKEAGELSIEEPFINDNSGKMGNQIDDILESNAEITQK